MLADQIVIIDDAETLISKFNDINLDEDVVFAFPEKSKNQLTFSFSGCVHYSLGEAINLSIMKSKFQDNSPLRVWKTKLDFKLCTPRGVFPLFLKPNIRSIVNTNVNYNEYLDVRMGLNSNIDDLVHFSNSVIYQNLEIETTFNKEIFSQESPTLILPPNQILFDILPTQTWFSQTYRGFSKFYIIKNTEFYLTFKEAI